MHLIPSDLSFVKALHLAPNEFGRGFSPKLHLDKIAPATQTLFIDADCLCVGNVECLFDRFYGKPVGVVGGSISKGEWFGDVKQLCERFNLASMPKFNGGIYYLEKGEMATSIYSMARELEKQYDELGLVRLRDRPNDELLIAISMARHGLKALPDDGSFMSDPQACPVQLSVNVLRGHSRLVNPPEPDSRHQTWYPHHVVHPLIVHFLGDYTRTWKYRAEEKKLLLVVGRQWPVILAEFFVAITFGLPQRMLVVAKNLFRPLYHSFFGARPVAQSPRI
jgi:hypothetical protein